MCRICELRTIKMWDERIPEFRVVRARLVIMEREIDSDGNIDNKKLDGECPTASKSTGT